MDLQKLILADPKAQNNICFKSDMAKRGHPHMLQNQDKSNSFNPSFSHT